MELAGLAVSVRVAVRLAGVATAGTFPARAFCQRGAVLAGLALPLLGPAKAATTEAGGRVDCTVTVSEISTFTAAEEGVASYDALAKVAHAGRVGDVVAELPLLAIPRESAAADRLAGVVRQGWLGSVHQGRQGSVHLPF